MEQGLQPGSHPEVFPEENGTCLISDDGAGCVEVGFGGFGTPTGSLRENFWAFHQTLCDCNTGVLLETLGS